MTHSRNALTAFVALGAVFAIPLAFAQADTTAATEAGAQAEAAATQTAAPAPTDTAKKVTWAELDGDKDGKLTKTEAAPLDSLSQVFDQADADADGALTADEYKAYVAKNGNPAQDKQG